MNAARKQTTYPRRSGPAPEGTHQSMIAARPPQAMRTVAGAVRSIVGVGYIRPSGSHICDPYGPPPGGARDAVSCTAPRLDQVLDSDIIVSSQTLMAAGT
jgi:hypothetical protein